MTYFHILTTEPTLEKYCLSVTSSTRKISNFKNTYPKIKSTEDILKDLKTKNKILVSQYKQDFALEKVLLHNYLKLSMFELPEELRHKYDGYYFWNPELYMEYYCKSTAIIPHTTVSMIISKDLEPYIDMNNPTFRHRVKNYLSLFVKPALSINFDDSYIHYVVRDHRGNPLDIIE